MHVGQVVSTRPTLNGSGSPSESQIKKGGETLSKQRRNPQRYEDATQGRSDRWEEKRRRFEPPQEPRKKPLRATLYVTIGAIVLGVVFVGLMTVRNSSSNPTASAATLQQQPASTAAVEGGKVSFSVQEVSSKKLVAWDYKQGGKTIPLLAYTTPSGAVKVASRMCEPCNSTSFRVEGNQLVCNSCGTRWDLESFKGISGGCQGYPPELLPGNIIDGKITVDEQKVASWKPRV
jgi:uncharacterized protein